jgi:hypothetical protein
LPVAVEIRQSMAAGAAGAIQGDLRTDEGDVLSPARSWLDDGQGEPQDCENTTPTSHGQRVYAGSSTEGYRHSGQGSKHSMTQLPQVEIIPGKSVYEGQAQPDDGIRPVQ